MARGSTGKRHFAFVLEDDRKKPVDDLERTTFNCGTLTGREMIEVRAAATADADRDVIAYRMAFKACQMKLLGWSRYFDEEGVVLEYLGEQSIDLMDSLHILEVGNAIMGGSKLGDKEPGKSVSPSDSQPEGSESSALPATPPGPEQTPAGDVPDPPPAPPPASVVAPAEGGSA